MEKTHLLTPFLRQAAFQPNTPLLYDKKSGDKNSGTNHSDTNHSDTNQSYNNRQGTWHALTYGQVHHRMACLASSLRALGLEDGDRVLLCGANSSDWAVADLGIMAAGGIVVPAYTTNTIEDFRYIIAHSEASIIICTAGSIETKIRHALQGNMRVGHLILIGEVRPHDMKMHAQPMAFKTLIDGSPPPISAESIGTMGEGSRGGDDVACIIYTSGTAGQPKGVMLTHRSIQANIDAARALLIEGGVDKGAVFLSLLPLSHAYEHTAGFHLPLQIAAKIYYCEGADRIAANLKEVAPTVMTAVPRLYEVLHARIMKNVVAKGGGTAWLFEQAIHLGTKRWRGERLSLLEWFIYIMLCGVVRRKLARQFGGRLKYFVSGGAALNPDIGQFFLSLGVNILQGYGQTEASPLISANRPHQIKIETVGPAVTGVEAKIASDGELLVRGDCLMKGYWRDEDMTRKTLIDGWLHTGDLAVIDAAGYITITGRKKDMIVNAGGDNISPSRVEGIFSFQPEIAQIMVFGDSHPFLVAVIVASDDLLDAAAQVKEAVMRVNKTLAPFERVRHFILADEPFTTENKQMTPTLKVRRHNVIATYGKRLEKLYKKG